MSLYCFGQLSSLWCKYLIISLIKQDKLLKNIVKLHTIVYHVIFINKTSNIIEKKIKMYHKNEI